MITKVSNQRCVLIILADGFEEIETIIWLSTLRQAGLCVKSVGVTTGLLSGAHGIWLMPDLTFSDLENLIKTTTISLVILPGEEQSLARLEAEPRLYKLLHQVIEQQGQIVTSSEGLQILRAAAVWDNGPEEMGHDREEPVLLRDLTRPVEAFAQELIRRLKQAP